MTLDTPGAADKQAPKPQRHLLFTFTIPSLLGGDLVTTIEIPFTIRTEADTNRLTFAEQGILETRRRNPLSEHVSRVSYQHGRTPPFPIKCRVVENTLAFEHAESGQASPGEPPLPLELLMPGLLKPDSVPPEAPQQ